MDKIFFSLVPTDATDKEFFDFVNEIAPVKKIQFREHKTISRKKGYGYIQLQNPNDKDKFFNTSKMFKGRRIIFQKFLNGKKLKKKQKNTLEKRIKAENVPLKLSDDQIKSIFEIFGKIESAFRLKYNGKPKTKAFITFFHKKDSIKCLESKKLFLNDGTPLYLYKYDNNKKIENLMENSKTQQVNKLSKKAFRSNFFLPTQRHYFKYDRVLYHDNKNVKFRKGNKNIKKLEFLIQKVKKIKQKKRKTRRKVNKK